MKNVDENITIHLPGGGTIKRKSDLQLFRNDDEYLKVKQAFEEQIEDDDDEDDNTDNGPEIEKVKVPYDLMKRIRLAHEEYDRMVEATMMVNMKELLTEVSEMYLINPFQNLWYLKYGEEGFEIISNEEQAKEEKAPEN